MTLIFTTEIESKTVVDLYVGTWPNAVASFWKAQKHWEAVSWVPGVAPAKKYDTFEWQILDMQSKILCFYGAIGAHPDTEAVGDA